MYMRETANVRHYGVNHVIGDVNLPNLEIRGSLQTTIDLQNQHIFITLYN